MRNQTVQFRVLPRMTALIILWPGYALLSWSCFGSGLQVAIPQPAAPILAVGPIENRDARYSPFTTRNFVDMLDFELVRRGYDTLRAEEPRKDSPKAETETSTDNNSTPSPQKAPGDDGKRQPTESKARPGDERAVDEKSDDDQPAAETPASDEAARQKEKTPDDAKPLTGESGDEDSASESATPDTGKDQMLLDEVDSRGGKTRSSVPEQQPAALDVSELLPADLRDVAGQTAPRALRQQSSGQRRFSKEEVAQFLEDGKADFFLQGSIGRTDTGDLLSNEPNTLIFLEIYGRSGERIGVVTFLISGQTLETPETLRAVCEKVAGAISGQVLNKNGR